MSILRHHTYAAQAAIAAIAADGGQPPTLAELERDYPRALQELKQRPQHHAKNASLIALLRQLGDWKD